MMARARLVVDCRARDSQRRANLTDFPNAATAIEYGLPGVLGPSPEGEPVVARHLTQPAQRELGGGLSPPGRWRSLMNESVGSRAPTPSARGDRVGVRR